MIEQKDLFVIPDDMVSIVPCQVKPELFENPDLDIDMDEDSWVLAPEQNKIIRLELKRTAEAKAVAACQTCPLMQECQTWAMEMGQDVFGVVGGLTEEQRPNHNTVPYFTDYTERGPLGQVRDDLIEQWAKAGIPNKQIAERLGCNVRTVERRRAGMAAGKIIPFAPNTQHSNGSSTPSAAPVDTTRIEVNTPNPETVSKTPLIVHRVSTETAIVYDMLIDGNFHDRSLIIEEAIGKVDKAIALKTAPKGRAYPTEQAQVLIGARKLLMNRIDIAIRRGRIQSVVTDKGATLIRLDKDTATTWKNHRKN